MTYRLTIQSIVQETSDTKSFYLKEKEGKLAYLPGQFLTLLLPGHENIRRSYSLSSHPQLDTFLRITVKRIANGEYSRWLFDTARKGDEIETIGASGFFTLPDHLESDTTILLLGAGSGITPLFSLLKQILYFQKQRVVLIDSNRSPADALFLDQLGALRQEFPNRLHIEFLFSNNKNLLRARLSKSLLSELIRTLLPTTIRTLVYLCGPRDYMQMALITLINENISHENIRTELFNTEKPRVKELPPDTEAHAVTIKYLGKQHVLTVKYPNSILQTAQLAGIALPYSCEAGRCGTCAATCTKGKIWMSRNEVLLDKEINKGRILTCTGYPVGGDAEVLINK